MSIWGSQGQTMFLVFVAPKIYFEEMKPTFEKMLACVQFD